MCLNILHLSDLHLNNNANVEDLAAKIHNASIENKANLSPDVIVVTGDIFETNDFSSADYKLTIKKAVSFFEYLLSHFRIDNLCEHLFFVPGNHEINRNAIKEDQLARYREFLNAIYTDKWNELAENIYDVKELCFVKHFNDKNTILVGLNSPRWEKSEGENTNGIGTARIGSTQINSIHKRIRSIEGYDTKRVVACLHNNIYNTIERTKKNIDASCVQDNELLLSTLNGYNCSLILHGHKHQLKNRRINLTQNIKEKDHICTVIGGGTLNELSTDSFNYVEIYDPNSSIDLVCKEFCDDSGHFKLSEHFSVPIQEDRRRFSKIKDVIQNDPNLNMDYEHLRNIDTFFDDKLLDMFDTTICAFKEISDNFFIHQISNVNLLHIMFGAIHYRSNLNKENSFLEQSREFIKKATDNINLSDLAFQMLDSDDIWELCDKYEEYKNASHNNEHKKILIFLALSIYLSEFFLTIKYRPNEFYNKYIQQKANYKLNESDIRTTISGNTIKFEVNEEHRALEITVRCSTANSHKVISLIIKEFELILSKFEEDFASIGFRVYYALPKLMRPDIDEEKLESYEFAAYIPRLIPLLAGKNIYNEPEAFTRELIQNSIDAIKVRAKQENSEEIDETKIELEIQKDKHSHQLRYFKITDYGTGMNRYVLERYLTTIGRSFYTSAEFQNLRINYSPISQFGIGFLSCFMLGKHVEVRTTHHQNPDETFYLDIPNYDGCFFIETKKNESEPLGSSITVWENENLKGSPEEFDIEKIKEYIRKIICNIPFDITLNGDMFIQKFDYYNKLKKETEKRNILFFIPLASDPDDHGNVLVDKTNANHSEHGIYFFKRDETLFEEQKSLVMNNGILVSQSDAVEEISRKIHPYLDVAFNFPSYALELEVSRDKLKHLKGFDTSKIKDYLQMKINEYLKSASAKTLNYVFSCLLDHKTHKLSKININFTVKSLNIDMGNYSLQDEIIGFCEIIEKIDSIIKKNKTIKFPRQRLEFTKIMDERFYHNIDSIFDSFVNHVIKNKNDFSEKIIDFQENFLYHNLSNRLIRKGKHIYYDIQNSNKELCKFIISASLSNVDSRIMRMMPKRTLEIDFFKNKFDSSVYYRAIFVMGTLKSVFSYIYPRSKLLEGISIPFDDSLISKVINSF